MNARETIGQLFRYAIVGLTLNGLGYLVYLALTLGARFDPMVVVAILYPVSVLASFFLNRSWTFQDETQIYRSLGRFLLAHITGYVINLGLLAYFWNHLGLPHPMVQAAAIFIVAGYLFLVFRTFVFKPRVRQTTVPDS